MKKDKEFVQGVIKTLYEMDKRIGVEKMINRFDIIMGDIYGEFSLEQDIFRNVILYKNKTWSNYSKNISKIVFYEMLKNIYRTCGNIISNHFNFDLVCNIY